MGTRLEELRTRGWTAFLLCVTLFLAQGCTARKAVIREANGAVEPRRVAVLPFESADFQVSGPVVCDYFTVQIIRKCPRLRVIERKDLSRVLGEQKLALAGLLQPDRFSKIGEIMGVDAILVGSIRTLEEIGTADGTVSVTIKVLEVPTGRLLWADHRRIAHATWTVQEIAEVADALIRKAASEMVERMSENLDTDRFSGVGTTGSAPAASNL